MQKCRREEAKHEFYRTSLPLPHCFTWFPKLTPLPQDNAHCRQLTTHWHTEPVSSFWVWAKIPPKDPWSSLLHPHITLTFLVAHHETWRVSIHNCNNQSTRIYGHPLWIQAPCIHEASRHNSLLKMQKSVKGGGHTVTEALATDDYLK